MNPYRDKEDRTIWIPFPVDMLEKGNGVLAIINLTRMRGSNGQWIYSLNYYDTPPDRPFKEYNKTHVAGFTLGERDVSIKVIVNSKIEKLQDFAKAILRELK